jgi:hypothetical protein
MAELVGSVPVDLGRVEASIREVEGETKWIVPLPGRTAIYQLFISLAMDAGAFEILMTPEHRQSALNVAHESLREFVTTIITKSQSMASHSGYQGNEVSFPVVVHEMDSWAARITCHCWPR